MKEYRLETGYSWDKGLSREINEDSILCTKFDIMTHMGIISAGLFAVADGMGGHSSGEIASDIAIRSLQTACIPALVARCPTPLPHLSIMAAAFNEANNNILNSASEGESRGMGTTLTAALVIGEDMYVAHIGDSRCYVINSWDTIQITKDHSIVQQLVDTGTITAEQARNHPRRNEITRVLGYQGEATPDLHHIKLYAGDNILLCSDGLHSLLPSNKMVEIVLGSASPAQACIDLTDQANLLGGPDNISVVIIKPGNLPSWQAVVAAQTSIRKI